MFDDLVLWSKRGVITFQLHLFSIDKVNGDKCIVYGGKKKVWGRGCGLFKHQLPDSKSGRVPLSTEEGVGRWEVGGGNCQIICISEKAERLRSSFIPVWAAQNMYGSIVFWEMPDVWPIDNV